MKTSAGVNCFEALAEIDSPLKQSLGDTDYLVLGGLPTAALLRHETQLDKIECKVIAPSDISLSSKRTNETRRDIDVLVMSSDEGLVNEAHAVVGSILGSELEVSVFGLRKQNYLHQRLRRLLTEFTLERIDNQDGTVGLTLGPMHTDLPQALFKPWRLATGKGEVSVLHPVAHTLCYRTRSIIGLRFKDRQKVEQMEANIAKNDVVAEEALKFSPWYDFADKIEDLAKASISDLPSGRFEAAVTLGKRALLARLEKHPMLIELAQKGLAQKLLCKIFVKSASG